MDSSIISPKCLVCFRIFPSERTKNCEEFAIVFDTFCRLLKVDLIKLMQWNFEQDHIPFCAFCFSAVKKLKGLYDQIESLQQQTTNILNRIKHEMQISGSDTDTNMTDELTANNRVNYFRRLVVGGYSYESNGADKAEVTSLNVDPLIKIKTELYRDRDNNITFLIPEEINESCDFQDAYIESDPLLTVKLERVGTPDCVVDVETFPQDNIESVADSIFLDTNTPVCSVQELYSKPEEINETNLEDHYLCQFCEKFFPEKYSLELHLNQHLDEKNINCETCNETFLSRNELILHQKQVHGNKIRDERPYKCDICNKSFVHSKTLAGHKRIHSGKRPYKCEVCNQSFIRSSDLTIHKRIHTGERPYNCEVCNKTFIRSQHLTSHKKVHTAERSYKCDVCNKIFFSPHSLTSHKITHTGERPYKCEVCLKEYSHAKTLRAHSKREHTGEQL